MFITLFYLCFVIHHSYLINKLFNDMKILITTLLAIILVSFNTYGQFKNYKVKGGVQYNVISPSGEFKRNLSSFNIRGMVAFELGQYFDIEIGGGFLKWKQKDHIFSNEEELEVDLIPIDLRIRFEPVGWKMKDVNPYFYVGGGVTNYKIKKNPVPAVNQTDTAKTDGWEPFIPVGLGLEVRLSKQVLLDFSAGGATTFTDEINNVTLGGPNDGWFNFGLGLVVTGKGGKSDSDRDGLWDEDEENIYATDPENPDTDGDGLKDGEEVKTYNTDPKNPDTDGDSLKDGDEVKIHLTKPNMADTDADGLKDGDEINTYRTNPLNQDTDNDGLTDGQEVNTNKTDPLKSDTDGDSLSDGDEVLRHVTNPLKMDTDNGSVDDGTEVRRGTNPLIASDDVVREEIVIGQVIVLVGINFETNSARITPDSEERLQSTLSTLKNNPNIEVEISGHTDSRGSNQSNQVLSENRANSVKEWLVAHGIASERITTIGYGENNPIAPNDSPENMLKNRRIEFKRTK
jgi:outer membrane protein OmpA-like peptidoglycan-associated protein